MKIAFIIYHEVIEDRISEALNGLNIDYFTEWENPPFPNAFRKNSIVYTSKITLLYYRW
jgi:hypothetical protein